MPLYDEYDDYYDCDGAVGTTAFPSLIGSTRWTW